LQKKIRITAKDNPTSLAKKILKQEHKLYPAAIMKVFN
jgi:phosphoribosylglycinamide formyltransferase-1